MSFFTDLEDCTELIAADFFPREAGNTVLDLTLFMSIIPLALSADAPRFLVVLAIKMTGFFRPRGSISGSTPGRNRTRTDRFSNAAPGKRLCRLCGHRTFHLFEPQCVTRPEDDAEHIDQFGSLIEGGGVVVPHFEGAEPIVSTSVAPSLI